MGFVKSVFCVLLFFSFPALAQDANVATPSTKEKQKKTFYFHWGYNRDWYSASTIHFVNTKTDNYDFVFHEAKAHDSPSMDRWWQPERLTIPQYDLNIGILFNDKHDLGFEIGWNHLKYIVTDNQVIHVTGNIRGHYIDKDTLVTPDFVHLQHTNGNNYLMFNLVKRQKILNYKNFQLSGIGKIGAGPMISYTISTILGNVDSGHFHYHGMVGGASLGLRFNFYKYFFIQSDMQGAYANYTNTELGADHEGLATHHFTSLQWTWEGGLNFPVGKGK